MASAPNTVHDHNSLPPYPPRRETNTLGMIGFVLALVGLVGCCFQPAAMLSLAGLILSVIGLSKRPKGLAIAGVVLGVIGLSGFLIAFLVIGAAVIALIPLLLFAAALAGPQIETQVEEAMLHQKVAMYIDQTGSIPADLTQIVDLNEKLKTDHWGTPYKLEVIDPGTEDYIIRSAGPDKVFGNEDDITTNDDNDDNDD